MKNGKNTAPIIMQSSQKMPPEAPTRPKKTFTDEEVKSFALGLLEKIMPKHKELGDYPGGGSGPDCVEWGMTKQEQLDRMVCLRAISDLDEHIENFKNQIK